MKRMWQEKARDAWLALSQEQRDDLWVLVDVYFVEGEDSSGLGLKITRTGVEYNEEEARRASEVA